MMNRSVTQRYKDTLAPIEPQPLTNTLPLIPGFHFQSNREALCLTFTPLQELSERPSVNRRSTLRYENGVSTVGAVQAAPPQHLDVAKPKVVPATLSEIRPRWRYLDKK
eukprot:gene6110-5963_t